MEIGLELLALAVLIGFSALYSGSEIGFYTVSSVQVDLDAQGGSRRARLMGWLLRNESALLVTILVGNNLALELATHVAESLTVTWLGLEGVGPKAALIVTAVLTPLVFLFGEALPKDVFRQRPYALTGVAAPVIALSRVVFWPLERILRLATLALEGILGLESAEVSPVAGREAVLGFLAEGRRHGALSERAEALASNALRLKSVPVTEVMVPWDQVATLRQSESDPVAPGVLLDQLLASKYSRLPVVGDVQGAVAPENVHGYVHQLEVLHNRFSASPGDAGKPLEVLGKLRPMLILSSEESIDAALGKFRAAGRRIGLVVEEGQVQGIVSVNDLLDSISGVVVA
jgi:CBS domain containing-hemolysin-like protein